ncbi:B3 domain-containing protein Os01g0234100-like [Hibiscus syriacus]|uniref:B3 domain-containing protein Os01g0234100-like n=1 Tax=Hibiscus syriacus TaxID=106335 RepID=UPI0019230F66|nr:B3 domain-containing protein Os01g0234100-like [Hibiscus syriacus]
MVLDEEGEEFEAKYLAEKVGLSGGWRGFSIAHKLLEGDICLYCEKKGSDEVDVALGLLKLESSTQQVDLGEERTQCAKRLSVGNTEDRNDPILHNSSNLEPTVDQSENERVDLVLKFRMESAPANEYYQLCCNQKLFLHENLLEGLNCKLVAGVIAETINIADAIRAAKITISHDSFLTWDKTLKSFEGLGMKVGFLCARLDQLMFLLMKSRRYKEAKLEQANANEEKHKLEAKLAEVTETLSRLDREIGFEQEKSDELEALFQEVANAPW